MARRAQSWMLEPIPGYAGLSRGSASLVSFPALPTDLGPRPTSAKKVELSNRSDRSARSELQNALYYAGMSFGLVVGTTLGLGVLGIAGF